MPLTDEQAEDLYRMVREIHSAMLARRAANSASPAPKRTASRPTVGEHVAKVTHDPNDPVVKVMPRNWKGEDLRGRRFSECPPLFLGQLSHMLDAFADKNEEDPERQRYAKWDRENAEAARKWRAKLESKTGDLFDRPQNKPAPMTDAEMDETF